MKVEIYVPIISKQAASLLNAIKNGLSSTSSTPEIEQQMEELLDQGLAYKENNKFIIRADRPFFIDS